MILKRHSKIILISLFLIITLLFLSNISLARAETITARGVFLSGVSNECYNAGDCDFQDIMGMIVNIAKVILKVVGAIALAMFVLGGLLWLTSAGKQQQVAKGKKILVNALIGLFIVFFAWSIIALLGNVLGIRSEYQLEKINIPATIPDDCGHTDDTENYKCMIKEDWEVCEGDGLCICKENHCGIGTEKCCK